MTATGENLQRGRASHESGQAHLPHNWVMSAALPRAVGPYGIVPPHSSATTMRQRRAAGKQSTDGASVGERATSQSWRDENLIDQHPRVGHLVTRPPS